MVAALAASLAALPTLAGVLPGLLGGTTRARRWWRGPAAYRVDVVDATGELDVVVDPAGSWTWDSEETGAARPVRRARRPRGRVRGPVLTRDLRRGVALQAVAVTVFLAGAWADVTTKDSTG